MAWYDKGQLLSYKCFFNMIVGNRGAGKSYAFKTWCIDDFIKNGNQFVWVRRYQEELDEFKTRFFEDIEHLYEGHELHITGSKKGGKIYVDKKLAGEYIPLSTSSKQKSIPRPHVDIIIFDEFLVDKSTYKYLKNEVTILMELIESVFRKRDDVRGLFLVGNNISFSNPYTLYFKIPQVKGRFWHKNDIICVENFANADFVAEKKATRFGKLVAGTEYEAYAIENKALLDNDDFIAKKSSNAKFICSIRYNKNTYGFWMDYKEGKMYVNTEYDQYSYYNYSITRDDHTENTFFIKNGKSKYAYVNDILYCFKSGCLYYANQLVKSECLEIMSKMY